MNKYLLLVLCTLSALFIYAQEQPNYLQGAVPEIEGKVVFSKTITVSPTVSDTKLFELMDKWVKENYGVSSDGLKNRILLSSSEQKNIACYGEKYLVFKKSALVLDQAKMMYQLILEFDNAKCNATIRSIRYEYSDSKSALLAEDLITDKIALKGNKLNRYYDKFRTHTIDEIDRIFSSIDVYLNGTKSKEVVGAAVSSVEAPVVAASVLVPATKIESQSSEVPGYRKITADKIPGNIVKLLNDWTLVTSGTTDELNVMTASWGGLGVFWDKPISISFLNPTRHSVQTMDKGDFYTISFYTEAYKDALTYCGSVSGRNTDKIKGSGLTPLKMPSGALAFSEAWMIIECRKIVSQQFSSDGVVDKQMAAPWSKDGYHKIYIGEIVNVWVK